MERVAIYDLDKTLVRRPTFTPFLIFASRTLAPWRLALLPMWVGGMAGYKLGLYDRSALKSFGMRLMLGLRGSGNLASVGQAFADHHIARTGWHSGVCKLLEEDRAAGARIVLATAAFAFYAQAFAELLGIDNVIATPWDGSDIPGGNCHGETKFARVRDWMRRQDVARTQSHIRMVSDSFADAPLLEWADEAIFVTTRKTNKRKALARGWQVISGAN